jgi:hypothetical protein
VEWVIGAVLIVLGGALLLSGVTGHADALISAVTGQSVGSGSSS